MKDKKDNETRDMEYDQEVMDLIDSIPLIKNEEDAAYMQHAVIDSVISQMGMQGLTDNIKESTGILMMFARNVMIMKMNHKDMTYEECSKAVRKELLDSYAEHIKPEKQGQEIKEYDH